MARLHATCSELLLPLLIGGLCADASVRISTASSLLLRLEQSCQMQFRWEQFSSVSLEFLPLTPYESLTLENALVENRNLAHLSSGITVDITAAAASYAGLAQEIALPGALSSSLLIRRVLRDNIRTDATPIPAWQHISNTQEWMLCPPWQTAQLESPGAVADAHLFRKLTNRPGSLCPVQIPHAFKTDP
jgi:hypothetical protein